MKNKFYSVSLGLAALGFGIFSFLNYPVQDATYTPRSANKTEKADGAQAYWKSIRANQVTGEVPLEAVQQAEQAVNALAAQRNDELLQFEFVGPDNVGGRTRVLVIDPSNSDILYAGGVTGGLFKSSNGGSQWNYIENFPENKRIGSMCIAANGDLYVGTGSTFEGSYDGPGNGIYKSTDGGASFVQLDQTIPTSGTSAFARVNRLKADFNNANVIYAATNRGLYVTTDGGDTWSNPVVLGGTTAINAACHDIELFTNGRVLVGYVNGLYYSDEPLVEGSYTKVGATDSPTPWGRIDFSIARSNENVVYAVTVNGGFLGDFWKSTDAGETWASLTPAFPRNSTGVGLFGDNGQGIYDLVIEVAPNNENKFYVGGVQLWRFDGNWTRASFEFASPFSPNYVHSDKHYIAFDPNNPNIMYVCTDGGVTKSPDQGENYLVHNRSYVTTQYYGIAYDKNGVVYGGTQDNGTHRIDNRASIYATDGESIRGGDGFDTEASQISTAVFTTVYESNIARSKNGGSQAPICGGFCDSGPFYTAIRLWESTNDIYSKDSIDFAVDTTRIAIGVGDGTKRTYGDTIEPLQQNASVVVGSVAFTAGISLNADDYDGDGVITGDATGTVDYATGRFELIWNNAPAQNLISYVKFTTQFNAGDVIYLKSATEDIPVEYTLPTALNPGDEIKVQDPVQTLLAMSISNGRVAITRDGLKFDSDPKWFVIGQGLSGSATCMEFSNDGNTIFIGSSGGNIVRVSGLKDLYTNDDLTKLTTATIYSGSQSVTGIALNESNNEILAISLGNYGNTNYVYLIENAMSATSGANAIRTSIQGNLPLMPVYDVEFDVLNPQTLVIGTDMGVYSTTDCYASNVEWGANLNGIGTVPVADIRQQKLGWQEASNHGMFYIGTHARGIWKSGSLVSTPEITHYNFNGEALNNLKVYPNPMSTIGNIAIDANSNGTAEIKIFDLTGKVVKQMNKNVVAGETNVTFESYDMPVGTYIATVKLAGSYKTSKFNVVR